MYGTSLRVQSIPTRVSAVKMKLKAAGREQVTAWINLHQTVRIVQQRIEERLGAENDLSWPELELLMRLRMAPDHQLQMSEIAAQLVGSPSGATRIADRLEKDGLIVRETPRENRRIVRVLLTGKGEKVLGSADETFRTSLQEAFGDHLTEAELVEFRRLLRKVLERNGAWQEARCDPGAATTKG